KFSVVNIIWKTESDNVSLSFSMVYQGVTKLFSIRTNIFTSKLKAQLSSIISILSSINDCIFFYKDIKITYHSFVDLLEKLVFHTKSSLYIQRFKGLGEMNPDQLWETTLDPTKRVLSQVSIEDFKKADLVFSTLMGDAVPPIL
ncbi:MAG: hypothetical protein ACPG9U_11325, partial [Paracoccaceae bacterium]